jgi:hypothetical protein
MHATVRRVPAYSALSATETSRFERSRRKLRSASGWLDAVFAIVVRPRLWWIAARQAARIARPNWWRRAPFLPIPNADYLRFRLETAYGDVVAPRPADLVAYLEWCASPGAGPRIPPVS